MDLRFPPRALPEAGSRIIQPPPLDPAEDGVAFDLLRAIRADIPILLASGYDETDAVARAAARDFAGFLKKPFTINRLTELVASALGLEPRE